MNLVCRWRRAGLTAALALAAAFPGAAQTPTPTPKPAEQKPAQPPTEQPAQPQQPTEPPKYEEIVVVTGSGTEGKVINAAPTMSVITAAMIELAPTQNFAELLRSVPGLNITQVSARDINVTSRASTGTLATGQLAMLDGRSLYQDFFGFVMWDFLPVNLNEIKQVEVIRGPASAVWGANAMHGVVNVISKSPREIQGTSVTVGGGTFDRSVDDDDADGGLLVYFGGTHAQAINDRWSFKISGGGYSQDALPRPTGTIPGAPGATQYPNFANNGTTQPKLDGRLDYDFEKGARPVVLRRRRRHRRHHAFGHRPLRHRQRLDDGLRPGELFPRRTACRRVHERPRRNGVESPDAGHGRRPDRVRLRNADLGLRSGQHPDIFDAPRRQLRRQPAFQHVRALAGAASGRIAPSSASSRRTRSSCPITSGG